MLDRSQSSTQHAAGDWYAKLCAWEARFTTRRVFVGVLLTLLIFHANALLDPPYWDGLVGAFPQALWLARHHFDFAGLLVDEKAFADGGACVYPFSLYPAFVGALYALGFAPKLVFLVVHLLVLVCAATAAAGFFELARRQLAAPSGMLATAAFVVSPLFQSLSSQMNMDMPLVACTVLSLARMERRAFGAASLWAALALLASPRGVLLVAANAAALSLAAWWRPLSGIEGGEVTAPSAMRVRAWWLAHVALLGVFALEVVAIDTYSSLPAHTRMGAGLVPLFTQKLWLVPEFGVAYVLALVGAGLVVHRVSLTGARWTDVLSAAFVLTFVAFFANFRNAIPRYDLQAYPYVLLALFGTLLASARLELLRLALLVGAIAWGLANHHGALYPSPKSGWQANELVDEDLRSNDGQILERSMEYRDDLLLDVALARHLESLDRERTILATHWPLTHVLAIPEFGYVERAWRTTGPNPALTLDANAVPWEAVYTSAVLPPRELEPNDDDTAEPAEPTPLDIRKKTDADVVWVVTPNLYLKPYLSPRTWLDECTATIEQGEHKAFVLHRVAWDKR